MKKWSKLVIMLLAATMILTGMNDYSVANVSASTEVSYETATKNSDGYYEIGNAKQLAWFAGLVDGTLSGVTQDSAANGILTADIDLSEVCHPAGASYSEEVSWTPIGLYASASRYKGKFDGQGHKISNLYINDATATYQGLFGYIHTGSSIKNITLENVNITAKQYIGAIAAKNNANDGGPATIENCIVESGSIKGDTTLTGTEGSGTIVGGIVGEAMGPVTKCRNNGATVTGGSCVGGISGWNYHSGSSYKAQINNCYNGAKITGTASTGAITGFVHSCSISKCCMINNCFYLTGTYSKAVGTDNSSIYNNNEYQCTVLTSTKDLEHLLQSGKIYSNLDLQYHYYDGYVAIHKCYAKSTTTSETVPSVIVGKPVSVIEANAFTDCYDALKDIYLPDTIETIEENAFKSTQTVHVTVSQNLTNLTSSSTEKYANRNEAYEITLTPDKGYGLPSSVRILHYQDELNVNSDYTYDSTTGKIVVNADKMDIGIAISASAKQITNRAKFINYKTNQELAMVSADENNVITVPRDKIEKDGYNYSYYSQYYEGDGVTDATGFQINEDDTATLDLNGTAGTQYIYVVITPKRTSVTYYDGTEKLTTLDSSYPKYFSFGDTVTFPNLEKEGYTFQGWYTSPDFTGSPVTGMSGTDYKYSEAITLYAKACNHEFENGFCKICGDYEVPTKNASGVYEIDNGGKLYWYAALVNGELFGMNRTRTARAVLTKDIIINTNVITNGELTADADQLRTWTPIGKSADIDYAGRFNGAGYSISGLYFNDETVNDVGLFGAARDFSMSSSTVTIENLQVKDSYFKGKEDVGGVVGNFQPDSNSYISYCSFDGIVKGAVDVGGIAGYIQSNAKIEYCENRGNISDTQSDVTIWSNGVGGIAGFSNGAYVYYSYNKGSVTASGTQNVGGITGQSRYMSGGVVKLCCNIGAVNGTNKGALTGSLGEQSGTILSNNYYKAVEGLDAYKKKPTTCTISGNAAVTDEQLASGEITYLLNSSSSSNTVKWFQNLGETNADVIPVLNDNSHGIVNKIDTGSEVTYSNLWLNDIQVNPESKNFTKEYDGTVSSLSLVNGEDFTWKGTVDPATIYYYTNTYGVTTSSQGAAGTGMAPSYAGTYYVKVTVDADATYVKTVSDYIKYEITRKAPAASDIKYTAPTNLIYDGSEKLATASFADGVVGLGTITLKYKEQNSDEFITSPKAVGTYNVYATLAQGKNYLAQTEPIDLNQSFTIIACTHDWGEWEETTPATYEDNGVETRTCKICGETETRPIAKLERKTPTLTFAETAVSKAYGTSDFTNTLTSETDGTISYASSETKVATVDVEGKVTIKGVGETTITATSAQGATYKAGSASYTLTITACTHEWGEWEVTTPATYTTEGVETRTCKICGETETRKIAVKKPPVLAATSSVTVRLYGYDDIQVNWSKVSGATGYTVYYKTSTAKAYSSRTTTSTTMQLANLSDGVRYTVKVVPYITISGQKYQGKEKVAPVIYTLKKVSTPKVSKKSSKKITVKWSNINGENGYQISKSTSKKKTGTIYTVKTTTGKSKVLSVKKGKTYYYKVRAYTIVGGKKIYGPWSSVKAYKLK